MSPKEAYIKVDNLAAAAIGSGLGDDEIDEARLVLKEFINYMSETFSDVTNSSWNRNNTNTNTITDSYLKTLNPLTFNYIRKLKKQNGK